MKYAEARPLMKTGDLVFYTYMNPLRALKMQGLAGLAGCLSNLLIVLGQYYSCGGWDGAIGFVHVGVIVRHGDAVLLAEYTAGQRGPGLNALSSRLAYPGSVIWLPVKGVPDTADLERWLKAHALDDYNFFGLPAAITKIFPGWRRPGKAFCSEAAVSMLQWLGVISRTRTVLRGQRLVEAEIEPHWFSPAEVTRLCPVDWERAESLEV